MILGDFNLARWANLPEGPYIFECKMSNNGYVEFNRLMNDYNLCCCDSLDRNLCGYTYCHASLDHYSLIDLVFVSSDIVSLVSNYTTVSNGANLSDHLPVQFDICCSFTRDATPTLNTGSKIYQLR